MSVLHPLLRQGKSIFAVGRNFAAHARELNNPVPIEPILFLKPVASYLPCPSSPPSSTASTERLPAIEIPSSCKEVHHEVELGVVIGKGGRDIPIDKAMDHVAGYVVAIGKFRERERVGNQYLERKKAFLFYFFLIILSLSLSLFLCLNRCDRS